MAERYMDRGISYVESWDIFENFLKDMGECPDGMELDRIDNDKGYSPDNCRWTERAIQSRNTVVIRSNNTSGYRGVSERKGKMGSIFRAYITLGGKYMHLGTFKTAEDAARAYNAEAVKHEGFPLNGIPE